MIDTIYMMCILFLCCCALPACCAPGNTICSLRMPGGKRKPTSAAQPMVTRVTFDMLSPRCVVVCAWLAPLGPSFRDR